ncbi:M48 family metallopeptidase [Streptosporangium sp. OZ121]|uniref:M48 family metallopeptidase n=1 Tax=Streptosporangium sp. OZ121 TaxID=3444183 RepID=UPI003F79E25B
MNTWLRALIAIALFSGLFILAIVTAGGLALYAAWYVSFTDDGWWNSGVMRPAMLVVAVAIAVIVGTWAALRTPEPPGLPVGETDAAKLWKIVDDLARDSDIRAPTEILLTGEPNVAVTEKTRLLGLIAGRRRLYIGAPVLATFTIDQLTAVIAHELGHYSRADTRLLPITYLAHETLERSLERLEKMALNGAGFVPLIMPPFRGYLTLFRLVSSAVLRRQEYAADRFSAAVAGPEVAVSALHRMPVVTEAWESFLTQVNSHIAQDRASGRVPTTIVSTFVRVFTETLDDEFQVSAEQTTRWDTHPPIADRIAAIQNLAEDTKPATPPTTRPGIPSCVAQDGNQPASGLLPNLDHYSPHLDRLILPHLPDWVTTKPLTSEPLEEYLKRIAIGQRESDADALYNATGESSANLQTVLESLNKGQAAHLAAVLSRGHPAHADVARTGSDRPVTPFQPLVHRLEAAFAVAAVRSGAARWAYDWSNGSATAILAPSTSLDLAVAAEHAVHSPEGAGQVRMRLARAGIDGTIGPAREGILPGADSGDVIGAMSGIRISSDSSGLRFRRGPHDLMIFTTGLAFFRGDPVDFSNRRLETLVQAVRFAQRPLIGANLLAYHDIRTVTVLRHSPMEIRLARQDGTTMTIRQKFSRSQLDGSRELLLNIIDDVEEPIVPPSSE